MHVVEVDVLVIGDEPNLGSFRYPSLRLAILITFSLIFSSVESS